MLFPLLLPLLATSAAFQSFSDVREGERILGTYHALLKEPRRNPQISKGLDFYFQAIRMDDSPGIERANFESLAAKYIALRAIIRETGGGGPTRISTVLQAIRAYYTPEICSRWSPAAQKLWLEATYVYDKKSSEAIFAKIGSLKRSGQDMETMEAAMLGVDTMTPKTMLPLAERYLFFAEKHPKDICAAFTACFILEAASFITDVDTRPHKTEYFPLVNRTFALEKRTLNNLNELLNDHQDKISYYEKLRKRMAYVH